MISDHSILAPSAAGIWGKPNGCTAWVQMSQQFPDNEDSIDAMEGDVSHEIGANLINAAAIGGVNNPNREKLIGQAASNGIVITDEMFDAAQLYADDVINIMRSRAVFGGPNFGVEKKLCAKRIHDLSYGTTDCFIYDPKTGKLFIWDYKFGHEVVEVFENWQLINYVAGIFDLLGIGGIADQHIQVHFRIAQPRGYHRDGPIREWTVMGSDLRAYFNILQDNANVALSNDAMLRTGSHCKHCCARIFCPAKLQTAMGLYETLMKPLPINLSNEALGLQLAIIKRAKECIKSLESGYDEQVKRLIRSGVNIPGWSVEQGYGRETWNKPINEVLAMGKMMGFDLNKPGAKTPNQAKQLGIDKSIIEAYSNQPIRGVKIVADDGSKARKIFNQ